jgi:hypothetical protein
VWYRQAALQWLKESAQSWNCLVVWLGPRLLEGHRAGRSLFCNKSTPIVRRAPAMESLPLWFLILALFLPRVSIIIAYFANLLSPFGFSGWVPPTIAVVVSRVLVSIMIFQDRGFSPWLLVHGIGIVIVYLSAGAKKSSTPAALQDSGA